MRAELANLDHCAVPFLSRATVNLCWYYYTIEIRSLLIKVAINQNKSVLYIGFNPCIKTTKNKTESVCKVVTYSNNLQHR